MTLAVVPLNVFTLRDCLEQGLANFEDGRAKPAPHGILKIIREP